MSVKLNGGQYAKRIMTPFLTVFLYSLPGDFPDLIEARKQIDIQHFGSRGAIEPLDIGILVRFPALYIVGEDTARLSRAPKTFFQSAP